MSDLAITRGKHLGLNYTKMVFPDSWVRRFAYVGDATQIPHVLGMRDGVIRAMCLGFPEHLPKSPEFFIQSLEAWTYAECLENNTTVELSYTQSAVDFIDKINATPLDSLRTISPPFPPWFGGFVRHGEKNDTPIEWSDDKFSEWRQRQHGDARAHNEMVEMWHSHPETMQKYPPPTGAMKAGIDFSISSQKEQVILGKMQILSR